MQMREKQEEIHKEQQRNKQGYKENEDKESGRYNPKAE